jgi:hypothetical protein
MRSLEERTEALRSLMERLCAPDLTLAEAKELRGRLSDLLETNDREAGPETGPSSPPGVNFQAHGEGCRAAARWRDPSLRAAG